MATVAVLFVTVQLLFPHYQALAFDRLPAKNLDLMVWVIAQNAGAGLFSLLTGSLADRCGNRLTLRLSIFAAGLTPLLAIALAGDGAVPGRNLYWLTFLLLGLTPVTFRTFVNYTLELADPHDHPKYISTLKLCMAVPFLLSPLVGWLVDVIGFEAVFVSIAALMMLGGLLTFRLSEPRQKL